MIIYLIFILLILVVLSWTLINRRLPRYLLGSTTAIALVASTGILTATFTNHYGLEKQATTTTHQVYSAAGKSLPAGILITKRLGSESNRYVMVYREAADGKATAHFLPKKGDTVNSIKEYATYRTADTHQATVKITTTRWEWRSPAARFWLNCGQAGELVSRQAVVTIPKKTWVVLSPSQLNQVKKQAKGQTRAQHPSTMSQQAMAELTVQRIKAALK